MKSLLAILVLVISSVATFAQDDNPQLNVDTTELSDYNDVEYIVDDSTAFNANIDSAIYNYDSEGKTGSVSPASTDGLRNYLEEEINNKKIDKEKWKEIVGTTDYTEAKAKEKKKKENKDSNNVPLSLPSVNPGIMKAVSYALIVALFAFILYYVVANTKVTRKVRKLKTNDVVGVIDDIDEFDSDGLLKSAMAGGDLRLAIRAHYLLLLRKLNEGGLIKWKKDKTNHDYLNELQGRDNCFQDVQKLTLAYEMVWYGERSVSTESFQRLAVDFEAVSRAVTPTKPTA